MKLGAGGLSGGSSHSPFVKTLFSCILSGLFLSPFTGVDDVGGACRAEVRVEARGVRVAEAIVTGGRARVSRRCTICQTRSETLPQSTGRASRTSTYPASQILNVQFVVVAKTRALNAVPLCMVGYTGWCLSVVKGPYHRSARLLSLCSRFVHNQLQRIVFTTRGMFVE